MKYVASCSFGKDSLAMVLRLIEERMPLDEVLFFDTGMEFNSVYNNRDKVKKVLFDKHIRYTELRDEENFLYKMLVKPVKYKNKKENGDEYHYGYEWCGGRCRWGTTSKLRKIQTHYKDLYGNETVIEYVGIAFDEMQRMSDDTRKIYPLVDWKMTEKDCLQYCYNKGYNWNEDGVELYSILDRVSCWCCCNKNLKELKNMYVHLPRYWNMLKGIQSRIDRPMKGEGKSVFQLEERFKSELEQKRVI